MLVEGCVVVEAKAVEKILAIHKAQLLSYMKLLNIPLGLLINFHEMKLTDGVQPLDPARSQQMKNKIQQKQTAYRGGINPRRTLVLRGKQREQSPKRKISVSSVTSCSNSGAASFPYWPRCSRALRIGALETLIIPRSGWFISRIIKIAPETDIAPMSSTIITVALRGANKPKLRNSMVSQKSSTTRKGTGSALCACSINSQRACSISLLICSACERSWRWASVAGVSERSFA